VAWTTAWRLAVAIVSVAALVSCADDDPGPLAVHGSSMVVEPLERGVWFDVRGCLRDGVDSPVDITVTGAVPSDASVPDHVDVRVAWYPTGEGVIGNPGEPPEEYRPLDDDHHSGGTLADCSLSLALVLSPAADRPVRVHGLDVTYVADGETYTAHAGVEVTLCPAGTRAGTGRCVPDKGAG
jgi:hypothetical protein